MYSKVKQIKSEVAKKWHISTADLEGACRLRMITWARHEAMARCRRETKCSYPEIARFFGGRHHTTVMYACRVYESNPHRF